MTMECREVRQLADAFVSEQLLVETTRAIVAHLEQCPACRAEVTGLRRLRAAGQSAFTNARDLAPRPEFISSLTARLQVEAIGPRPTRWMTWLGMAASLLLVLGLAFGAREWSVMNLSALLHAAIGDHRFCALDFKLAEKPITLEEAARRFDPVNRRLEGIEPSTTTLSGGPLRILERHSCVFDGRRFAHIVLGYQGQAVSLLVTTDEGLWTIPSSFPVTDGFHATALRGSKHVAFVVSALGDEAVREVAAAMAGPVAQALAGV
jgi:Putative zinc-finger